MAHQKQLKKQAKRAVITRPVPSNKQLFRHYIERVEALYILKDISTQVLMTVITSSCKLSSY